ncbi:hypothetical protein [Streptomyces sp. NPDC054794]
MPVFDPVLGTLRGGSSLTGEVGLALSDLVVVGTHGAFEQADSLKTAYNEPSEWEGTSLLALDDGGASTGPRQGRTAAEHIQPFENPSRRRPGRHGDCHQSPRRLFLQPPGVVEDQQPTAEGEP